MRTIAVPKPTGKLPHASLPACITWDKSPLLAALLECLLMPRVMMGNAFSVSRRHPEMARQETRLYRLK